MSPYVIIRPQRVKSSKPSDAFVAIIGSDNGFSPYRHQAIIWINSDLLSSEYFRTTFNYILVKTQQFSFIKRN